MPKIKLTKREVDRITPGLKPAYYFDTDLPGFFLRCMPPSAANPKGARAWGFEYRSGSGRASPKKRITIATFGKITPEEARAAAKCIAADVTRGHDPASAKSAKSREPTMADLVALYEAEGCFVQRGIRQGEPMKPLTRAYTIARLRHHVLPLIGRKRCSEVGPGEIERFVRDVASGKSAKDEGKGRSRVIVRGGEGAARKVVRDLSAVFSFAVRRGLVTGNPCEIAAVRKTDNKRERFLSLLEVERLGQAFHALENEGVNPKAINIARLWALTGCRRNEIAGLRWLEVDLKRGLLVLADSKTGKSTRPLGAPASILLAAIPREPGSDYVFPGVHGSGHYQGTKRVWPEAIRRANLPGVTPHTLRHTMGSIATSSGEALALTGSILGHANYRSTSIYAHVAVDPARQAADRVSKTIGAAFNKQVGE